MTLRVRYPQIAVQKARRLARAAEQSGGNQRQLDRLCQDTVGLTHRYLTRIGTIHKSPSNRALDRLGYELVLRDKTTGEEEVMPLLLEET